MLHCVVVMFISVGRFSQVRNVVMRGDGRRTKSQL